MSIKDRYKDLIEATTSTERLQALKDTGLDMLMTIPVLEFTAQDKADLIIVIDAKIAELSA